MTTTRTCASRSPTRTRTPRPRPLRPSHPTRTRTRTCSTPAARATSPFPISHSRENCLESLWKPGNEKHACPNCYCFVCDKPVSECPEWDEHCMATNTQPKWISMRALWKQHGGKPPSAPAAASAAARRPPRSHRRPQRPRALTSRASAGMCRRSFARSAELPDRGVRAESLHQEREAQAVPAAVARIHAADRVVDGPDATWQLEKRYYQGRYIRGGWLCDEMGMGKTAVCAALCCSAKDTATGGLTVVVVNNSLVGQWVDELKKFAPGLKAVKYYGPRKEEITKAVDVVDHDAAHGAAREDA